MRYLIDTSAWIEYFDGSDAGKKMWSLIKRENNEILTLSINLAEIVSKFKRKNGDYNGVYGALLSNSGILDVSPQIAKEAGILHAEIRKRIDSFGMTDAFVVCAAKSAKAIIVTKDNHFKSFKNVMMLK